MSHSVLSTSTPFSAIKRRFSITWWRSIYNLCDIDATSESRKFEKSICHFLTNRKRPFFLLANKRARRIMNLVESDWIDLKFLAHFCLAFWLNFVPSTFVIVKHCHSSLRIHSAIASWIHSYFDNVMTKFMINNRTDAWKTDVHLSIDHRNWGFNQTSLSRTLGTRRAWMALQTYLVTTWRRWRQGNHVGIPRLNC